MIPVLWIRLAASAVGALAIVLGGAFLHRELSASSEADIATIPRDSLTPRSSARVYWVGHSLMNFRHDTDGPADRTIMELVGDFARSQGLEYAMGDHTGAGASMSLNWRGRSVTVGMTDPVAEPRRREFVASGNKYDTLAITESIPIAGVMKFEHSAYYLRKFYCAALNANPNTEVFLYENWVHYQANDPLIGQSHRFDWRKHMVEDRPRWEQMADAAARGGMRSPTLRTHVLETLDDDGGSCDQHREILLIPVGTALVRLRDRLQEPQQEGARWVDEAGEPLRFEAMFQNPYTRWPADWPLSEAQAANVSPTEVLASFPRAHPDQEIDDVHPSRLGRYLAALVSYAVIYRRSPVGLPTANRVAPELAAWLQGFVWDLVQADPRTGLRAAE